MNPPPSIQPDPSQVRALLLQRVLQSPKVQSAISGLAVDGVEIGTETLEKIIPIVEQAAAKTASRGESAAINAVQGIIDVVPGLDDLEGIIQEAIAGADLVGTFASAGTGILTSVAQTVNIASQESARINSQIEQLADAINEALPSNQGIGPIAPVTPVVYANTRTNKQIKQLPVNKSKTATTKSVAAKTVGARTVGTKTVGTKKRRTGGRKSRRTRSTKAGRLKNPLA